jgi:uncharacterized protein (TIGR00251 family)
MTCELAVRAVPRASRRGITGIRDDVILVRIGAAPVDGAANAELIETLANALDLPKRALTIVAGASSRTKRVRIDGLSHDAALERLGVTA